MRESIDDQNDIESQFTCGCVMRWTLSIDDLILGTAIAGFFGILFSLAFV